MKKSLPLPEVARRSVKSCFCLACGCLLTLALDACHHHAPAPVEPDEDAALSAIRQPGRADWGLSSSARLVRRVKVEKPYVAVTFDDGPNPSLTPRILDIFKKHGAHATFFVLGRSASCNRSVIARAVEEGHEVASHTWSHIDMRKVSEERLFRELDRTSSTIEKATGYTPWVMRPPYGAVNSRLADMVYKRYGTPAILWDVDTRDWRRPGVQKVVRRAVDGARPGSIILLHDIHPPTLAAVEDIVTGLQARGFKLVTVSQLLASGPAGVPKVASTAPKASDEKEQKTQEKQPEVSAEKEASEPVLSQKQPTLPEESSAAATSGTRNVEEPLPPVLLKKQEAAPSTQEFPAESH